ncbi:MAG TPA: heparan-alpha-glucosaminide N-acetyltransferase domain-containing protein [Gemmatimonadaceae bacterium]|nr:heparan-alpha-glucosaminide N-acetyltransferase domain-containing protein [Gemmatimonadaceae bacterium]
MPTPPAPAKERLLALDVFRGLTIAGMLLVNNPGNWGAIYPPLTHAAWHGWTPTDLIFPFFLFIVGVTTHFSLDSRRARGADDAAITRQILRRSALIILFGLLLAAFPFWPLDRFTGIRIPGVLQRIGVAYLFGALITQRTTWRQQVGIIAALLLGYWFIMTMLPVPGQEGLGRDWLDTPAKTLAAWVDRALLDGHLWSQSRTWDPEGVLSTIPAIGTVMLGVLCGRWLRGPAPLVERLSALFAVGAIVMVAGLMWNWVFPINKALWTSSYVLFTGGMAATALATILWITDVRGVRWWTRPFVIYGVNPIIAFVGSGMMARVVVSYIRVERDGRGIPLKTAVYEWLATWLDPRDASLAYAVGFVLVWLAILTVLERRGIIFKV